MPLPAGTFVRYSLGGKIISENWRITMWQQLTGGSGIPTQTQLATAAAFRLAGFNTVVWSHASALLKSINATTVNLSQCEAQYYVDGVIQQSAVGNISAVAGTGAVPQSAFSALCCSMLSGFAGRSSRGRVYLPATAMSITAATFMTTYDITSCVSQMADWVAGFGPDDTGFPGDPASQAVIVSRTHGTFQRITACRIDNKPDTQRGREGKLAPTNTQINNV